MKSYYELARAFQEEVGQPAYDVPTLPKGDRRLLRFNMLVAEFSELMCALYGIDPEDLICKGMKYNISQLILDHLSKAHLDQIRVKPLDFANVARQIVDMHFVLSGTSAEFGLPEEEVFVEVWTANMMKAGGPKRDDGKQLPPPGWEPPDVQGVLDNYTERYNKE